MFNNWYFEIIKMLSILILLALPPFLALIRYSNLFKKKKYMWFLIFIPYVVATLFTQNLLPFIAVILTLYFIKKQNDEELMFHFRSLKGWTAEIIGIAVLFKFAITILSVIYVFLLTKLGFTVESQEVIGMFLKASWIQVIFLSITTVIFAPIVEEFIFRHMLYRGVKKKNKAFAVIFTSLLFTLLHYNLAGSLSFFAVGILNCYLYDKFGYRAAVLNHVVFNFISVVLIIAAKVLNLPLSG
ncbi:CAAX amino terminal protease self- immunity [Caloramator mitchellensis]|uniref:CAAX amino terminal protease self-immunity n=1 Tax=Caloramator mitchellensis TaxID=908809 RepID=A0A0R3JRS1_CALMK|nr:type II CAAX endopeptidase family protein [Caloramator mitchellensis]KRQ86136.1 CAAX amino terminal protease self- immunity [Caloramator mitchellensis]